MNPALAAALAKALRAEPTGTKQSIAAWTCVSAMRCAASSTGHLRSSQ